MKVSITEIELNRLLTAGLPADVPVTKLAVNLTAAAIVVTGEYQMMFAVPFRTEWLVSAVHGGVEAHLSDLQVAGFAAGKLRGILLKLARDAVKEPDAVKVNGERLWVDVPRLALARGAGVRPEVVALRVTDGELEVEAVLRPG